MLMAGAAGVGLASTVNAGLLTTVEAFAASNAGDIIAPGGKSVAVAAVGDTITFRVFAQVTGANASVADDGLILMAGSFKSSTGGMLGNLSATRQANTGSTAGLGFTGTGGNNGTIIDLDADTDSDVGSNDPTSSDGFFNARANVAPNPAFQGDNTATDPGYGGTNDPFGNRLLVGTLKFVVTSTGTTTVNFFKREASSGGALWAEDSVPVTDSDGNTTFTGTHSYDPQNPTQWTVANGVVLNLGGGATPEPASLGLLGMAGLGLLSRRRK